MAILAMPSTDYARVFNDQGVYLFIYFCVLCVNNVEICISDFFIDI